MKRYFLVFYVALRPGKKIIDSQVFTTFGQEYLVKSKVLHSIVSENFLTSMKDVMITNIIELNEMEFKTWIS